MNEVFADMLDVCVVIYLDDILIFTDDPHNTPNKCVKYSDGSDFTTLRQT